MSLKESLMNSVFKERVRCRSWIAFSRRGWDVAHGAQFVCLPLGRVAGTRGPDRHPLLPAVHLTRSHALERPVEQVLEALLPGNCAVCGRRARQRPSYWPVVGVVFVGDVDYFRVTLSHLRIRWINTTITNMRKTELYCWVSSSIKTLNTPIFDCFKKKIVLKYKSHPRVYR